MIRRPRQSQNAGFTLLELLVSLALMSLITSAVLGGLHLGRHAFESGKAAQATHELDAAATAISNLLAKAFPATILEPTKGPMVAFAGQPDGCLFVSLSEGESQRGGLILTDIGLDQQSKGTSLSVWTDVFRTEKADTTTRATMTRAEALRDVTALEFRYFGSPDPQKAPQWLDIWPKSQQLPQLVSVRIEALRQGRRVSVSFTTQLTQKIR